MNAREYWRTPLDLDRWPVPHGRVRVLADRCKGCELCIVYCPVEMLEPSPGFNPKGFRYPVVTAGRDGDCVACGYCQSVCPDFAIVIETEVEP